MSHTANEWNDIRQALVRLERSRFPHWENYYGFYSSWLGGYFREPWAMLVPMDDHGFHRGDGVFEAVRIYAGAYFDLDAHLARLERSAAAISMALPQSQSEIKHICLELARRCGVSEGLLRLYVSRGPGGFSTNPAEVTGQQIYMALTKLRPPTPDQYKMGVIAGVSEVAAKPPDWARVKSLNYLQNVLMKHEAVQAGLDFTVSVDASGRVCEGSTENLLLVSHDGRLQVPRFDYTLRGTTVSLVMQLAEELVASNQLKSVETSDLAIEDLKQAREVAFVGTTLGVLPVRQFNAQAIAVGPICALLHDKLSQQMRDNPKYRSVF